MRKLLKLALLAMVAIGFVGCGGSNTSNTSNNDIARKIAKAAKTYKEQQELQKAAEEYYAWKEKQQIVEEAKTQKEKTPEEKAEIRKTKCLGGNMESCDIVIKEYGSNLNCNNYMKILRKGCNLGSGYCCALLGNEFHSISVYQGGRWEPKYGANCSLRNQNEAFKYYKKACDLGESLGCKQYTELQNDIDEIDRRERDKTQKSDITIRRK